MPISPSSLAPRLVVDNGPTITRVPCYLPIEDAALVAKWQSMTPEWRAWFRSLLVWAADSSVENFRGPGRLAAEDLSPVQP